ncbi:3-isopropylmalate dehydratase small subunit [Kitasatospora viridis]|uniref:3-isopropylmalate dehydratase small subunit n=1 Tax=Kitasatospora viridis TaxID=281105 RepID=A0A561T660_9ACTN|nr:3-isopropylmalate dehydratase small subunit [Kitasatospora viridis]TWF82593.1 3-isopropylmalate dehydratase small subunit [Kitasatospora viridis]
MGAPLVQHTGRGLPLGRDDVDTDQIVPARFCRRITRTGYDDALFADWRGLSGFPLSDQAYAGATVLLAGRNFGTGSSREHAVWALRDWGFRVVLASSFGDIFLRNALNNGLLAVTLPPDGLNLLLGRTAADPAAPISVDLAAGQVEAAGHTWEFEIDGRARELLLTGADEIDSTLERGDLITRYEAGREPWTAKVG